MLKKSICPSSYELTYCQPIETISYHRTIVQTDAWDRMQQAFGRALLTDVITALEDDFNEIYYNEIKVVNTGNSTRIGTEDGLSENVKINNEIRPEI